MAPRRHQSRNVRNVRQQHRAARLGNLAHALKVDQPRVRARTHCDHCRPVLRCHCRQLVVIDPLVLLAYAVVDDVKKFSGKVRRIAMRQVAAVTQVHRQHLVARFQHSKVHAHVRAASGMRLHIRILTAEKFLRTVNGQLLRYIHVFTAAVPPLAGITFRILVGQR